MIGKLLGNIKLRGNRVFEESCFWFMMIVLIILLNFLYIEMISELCFILYLRIVGLLDLVL